MLVVHQEVGGCLSGLSWSHLRCWWWRRGRSSSFWSLAGPRSLLLLSPLSACDVCFSLSLSEIVPMGTRGERGKVAVRRRRREGGNERSHLGATISNVSLPKKQLNIGLSRYKHAGFAVCPLSKREGRERDYVKGCGQDRGQGTKLLV